MWLPRGLRTSTRAFDKLILLQREEEHMRPIIGLIASALLTAPALADDRDVITAQMQELSDAIASGRVAIWDKYLDPSVIYAEEDDSYKGKAEMLKEILPLPKGLGGTIKIEMLSYHEDGDVAVGLFRQDETEHYYGQTIYAKYLTNTTWKKRPDGWKMIASAGACGEDRPSRDHVIFRRASTVRGYL